MGNEQVSVLVPHDRVAEFYEMYGKWLQIRTDKEEIPEAAPANQLVAWTEGDEDQAASVFGKLSPQSRKLFERLIDKPSTWISAKTLAHHLEFHEGDHRYVVAGLLSWPSQYCREVGRQGFWCWKPSEDENGGFYLMKPEIAALFSRVREHQPTSHSTDR